MRLIRDGEKGGRGFGGGGKREIIYLSLHCHHQNDSCIKMGSDESHLNVWRGSRPEGDYNYTYRYTVAIRMTPTLRLAAMTAILMSH